MELLIVLLAFVGLIMTAIITRWIFRIDHIVLIQERTEKHLKDIREQGNVLIEQQDDIIKLIELDTNRSYK